jgi:molybdate transport system ATP-binding protein
MPEGSRHSLSISAKVSYPGFSLDIDQSIELGGVTGLFGPSGGGKSTLLRIIAGFERNVTGAVGFSGSTWQDSATKAFVPAHRRPVGFVFQDSRLFPHLNVAGNLRYARERGVSSGNEIGFAEVIATLDLEPLLEKEVNVLSGGERQRVAIGRTLLAQPELLLLDEPLAALDVGRKSEILPYIEALPKRFGIPAIFVSHAVNEMARLADNVVVLEAGRVTATGSASSILSREELQLSSLPFEAVTILEVRVREHLADLRLTRVEHRGQNMTVPSIEGAQRGDTVRLSIRSGDVVLATHEPQGISVRNVLRGTLLDILPLTDSAFATVSVDVDGTHLKAQLTRHAIAELGLEPGRQVFALIKTASFDRSV